MVIPYKIRKLESRLLNSRNGYKIQPILIYVKRNVNNNKINCHCKQHRSPLFWTFSVFRCFSHSSRSEEHLMGLSCVFPPSGLSVTHHPDIGGSKYLCKFCQFLPNSMAQRPRESHFRTRCQEKLKSHFMHIASTDLGGYWCLYRLWTWTCQWGFLSLEQLHTRRAW